MVSGEETDPEAVQKAYEKAYEKALEIVQKEKEKVIQAGRAPCPGNGAP